MRFDLLTRRPVGIVLLTSLVSVLSAAARDAEPIDVQQALELQAQQIRALQDEVRMLRDELAAPESSPALSMADVDRRIEAFETHPTSQLFVSGYGAAGYSDQQNSDGSLSMLLVPIFHYKLSDQLHLTGELELDLRGSTSEVAVEYAQIDYLLNDYLTLSIGKFLLPFNAFSERLHPSWINKLPSLPPIYGAHGSGGGIVPILSDTGVQVRGGLRLPWSIDERGSRVNYAFYMTNGPRLEPESDFEKLAEFLTDEGVIADEADLLSALGVSHGGTEIEFGETFRDNNQNKAIGGRLGLLPVPQLEIGASFLQGSFDDHSDLDLRLYGFDLSYRLGPLHLLGEFMDRRNDKVGGGTERINGYYLQGGLLLRDLASVAGPISTALDRTELVLRTGEVDDDLDYRETTFGVAYWLTPSVPLKLAYTWRDEDHTEVNNDQLLLQIAFGF
ncbi:MAG: hypothetical protein ACE5FG_11080 [Myxococcota bacterium]